MSPRIVTNYRPRVWDDCGTMPAWNRHAKTGRLRCTDCLEFGRRYARERRQALKSKRAFVFPVEIATLPGIDGLGLSIAQAFRESA